MFIYGDGGAFKRLSRISCEEIYNTKHIVNGIGENPEDRVIILSKKSLFQMKVK